MQNLLVALLESKFVTFFIVYLSFLLDNILLTVVVPIIPDYLFSSALNANYTNTSNIDYRPTSLSPLQRKFEALEKDNGPLGVLLASKAFVQLAFTPFVGYLIEIMGCSVPMLIGSCNMLLASTLFAYGNSYGILVLARALHGSASAAIAVSGMCILAKKLPNELRARVMPLAFGGIALGVLIGYPLGGAAYQLMGKTAPFLIISFFIGVNIILQVVCLKDEYVDMEAINKEINYSKYLVVFKDKRVIIASIVICISTSTMAILEPCVPMWLLAKYNPPPSRWQLGAVFIPDSFGYFIGSHFTGLLLVERWRISLSAMVVIGLSCCGVPLANTLTQLVLPHFGIGLGVGIVDAALVPLLSVYVEQKGNSHYGPIYALQQASVAIAYSFGPLIAGQAVHIVGFPWLIRIVGFMNLITCPLLLELESKNGILSHEEHYGNSYSTIQSTN